MCVLYFFILGGQLLYVSCYQALEFFDDGDIETYKGEVIKEREMRAMTRRWAPAPAPRYPLTAGACQSRAT